jgi:SPP1 family predicted phage head-tail adaptor
MQIGDMKDRITILKPKEQTSIIDLSDDNFDDYITVWSKVEYVSVKEMYSSEAVNFSNTLKFIIRYREDIKNNMAIRYKSNTYKIQGIKPLDKMNTYLIIVANIIENEGW